MDNKSVKMALGCDSPVFKKGEDVAYLMDAMLQEGANIFDSARLYGKSEEVIGKYINDHQNRKDCFIITKGCHPMPFNRLNVKALRRDLEQSLRTLNIGYIDLYLLHRDHHNANLKEILDVLNKYKAKGKILHYGLSNWSLDRIKEFNTLAEASGYEKAYAISNNFTLIPWEKDPWGGGDGCVSFSNDKEAYEYLKETQTPLLSYSPLARGFLSGRVKSDDPSSFDILDRSAKRAYCSKRNIEKLKELEEIAKELGLTIPELTLAYLANTEINVYPIIGTTSAERLKKNIESLSIKLSKDIMERLKSIAFLD